MQLLVDEVKYLLRKYAHVTLGVWPFAPKTADSCRLLEMLRPLGAVVYPYRNDSADVSCCTSYANDHRGLPGLHIFRLRNSNGYFLCNCTPSTRRVKQHVLLQNEDKDALFALPDKRVVVREVAGKDSLIGILDSDTGEGDTLPFYEAARVRL